MDKLEFIKIKNFFSYIKDTVEKKRIGKPLTGENICTTVFEKGFVSRIHTYIYKEYMQLNNKKTAQIKNGQKNLSRHCTEEAICVIDTEECLHRSS